MKDINNLKVIDPPPKGGGLLARIKNGLDYCAKCPDGYICASGKKND